MDCRFDLKHRVFPWRHKVTVGERGKRTSVDINDETAVNKRTDIKQTLSKLNMQFTLLAIAAAAALSSTVHAEELNGSTPQDSIEKAFADALGEGCGRKGSSGSTSIGGCGGARPPKPDCDREFWNPCYQPCNQPCFNPCYNPCYNNWGGENQWWGQQPCYWPPNNCYWPPQPPCPPNPCPYPWLYGQQQQYAKSAQEEQQPVEQQQQNIAEQEQAAYAAAVVEYQKQLQEYYASQGLQQQK